MRYCCMANHGDNAQQAQPEWSLLSPCGKNELTGVRLADVLELKGHLACQICADLCERYFTCSYCAKHIRTSALRKVYLPSNNTSGDLPASQNDCKMAVFHLKKSIGLVLEHEAVISRFKATRRASNNAGFRDVSTQLQLNEGKRRYFEVERELQTVGMEYENCRKHVSEAYHLMENKRTALELCGRHLPSLAGKAGPEEMNSSPTMMIEAYPTTAALREENSSTADSRVLACEKKVVLLTRQFLQVPVTLAYTTEHALYIEQLFAYDAHYISYVLTCMVHGFIDFSGIVFDNSDNRFPTSQEVRRTIILKKDEYNCECLALLKDVAGTKAYEQRRVESFRVASFRIMAETDA
ncbi:hypothetical protein BJ138DRAFT_1102769 [Hygrophoropsis aurantiaca]|uniref:Uncharacterized protein n=1 Tax=Hygrophoropsis aurantiaca TaxID=72124 RepID=A0ACB8A8F3_9AGAM|nr:hypothetical protein BJ138DRAFT_1102769 [Hygrophoropsis aurantiaca]